MSTQNKTTEKAASAPEAPRKLSKREIKRLDAGGRALGEFLRERRRELESKTSVRGSLPEVMKENFRNEALSNWIRQYGEGVIHLNDYTYFEACEAALKACVKYLKAMSKTFDGARAGDDAAELLVGIDTLFDGADPLRGTEGASFVKSLHTKRESNRWESSM